MTVLNSLSTHETEPFDAGAGFALIGGTVVSERQRGGSIS
jgi:hypothetical protein